MEPRLDLNLDKAEYEGKLTECCEDHSPAISRRVLEAAIVGTLQVARDLSDPATHCGAQRHRERKAITWRAGTMALITGLTRRSMSSARKLANFPKCLHRKFA
ncbi:hypothetical protein WN51_04765 [Melipona quadrifasciata]|uniref:Uncharacterized protein n=1 Tax=Melipona quadrifasciata TaxID=166423 RepID=A0A0N0BDG1_9HYME|nr:hypothetical protein WN51_04765 [Melipona quadrifasciata]